MELTADCARCVGLCCVVPAFARSVDFAIDKPARQPCPNLGGDFRCGIHQKLRTEGFRGCTVYDCFGAGQHLTQSAGGDWRAHPELAGPMFTAFPVMRELHELLWYLTAALDLKLPAAQSRALATARDQTETLTELSADGLTKLDVAPHWAAVNDLLVRASATVRRTAPGARRERRGADLVGKDLRRTDLRAANLRGAYLIGADLRDADLGWADLIGADLRDADLRGARLATALFLTQPQLESARGDGRTALPRGLRRPAHWTSAS
ncbi:pentapeptide repeat-containing protein [Asanoa sp. WMMD1127]|nr:pentapeptide repeat-containing protein [Asanoa sp. WMMD1127]MDG4823003.1 pentapeptide repeat-containing protein [Asanoa sp. WMMD1127]